MPSEPIDRDFMHIWLSFDDVPGGATCITVDMRRVNVAMNELKRLLDEREGRRAL